MPRSIVRALFGVSALVVSVAIGFFLIPVLGPFSLLIGLGILFAGLTIIDKQLKI